MVSIENMRSCHLEFILQNKHQNFTIDFLEWENFDILQRTIELNPFTNKVAIDLSSGKLVGYILGGDTGLRGVLHHLFVFKEYRSLGVGNLLVAECIRGFSENSLGARRILGLVYGSNASAIKILKQNGFIFNPALEKEYPFVIPCYLDL